MRIKVQDQSLEYRLNDVVLTESRHGFGVITLKMEAHSGSGHKAELSMAAMDFQRIFAAIRNRQKIYRHADNYSIGADALVKAIKGAV